MIRRVIWFPTGSRAKSSSRIQVYNIHNKLLELGYNSVLGYEPKRTIWHLPLLNSDIKGLDLRSDDLVIIQKFKKRTIKTVIKKLRKSRAKIGYIDCDEPIAKPIAKKVDFVIVPSRHLMERYQSIGAKCFYIPDCPERFLKPNPKPKINSVLKCVWFGNYSNSKWKEVLFFQRLLKEYKINNWTFETISNTRKATKRWNRSSFEELTKYDLVVIPVPDITEDYKVKSANRLLQSMALGLPILSSPVPEYLHIIDANKLNNIICETPINWKEMLSYFESSVNRNIALNKNYEVAISYHLDRIIYTWIDIFELKKEGIKKETNKKVLEKIRTRARLLGYEITFSK